MWVPVLLTSLVFIGIGLLLNPNNARYLLSGYNTMPPDKQAQFDIRGYLRQFRPFMIGLGTLPAVGFALLQLLGLPVAAPVFFMLTLLVGLLVWLVVSRRFGAGAGYPTGRLTGNAVTVLLVLVIVGIVGFGYRDLQAPTLQLTADAVQINGSYGRAIPYQQIQTVQVVDSMPKPTWKLNGFALGPIVKGYFKTPQHETALLMGDLRTKPCLALTTRSGLVVYWNNADADVYALQRTLKQSLP